MNSSTSHNPKVLSFINQKGGCGKSSLCFHAAGAFAAQGEHVLLIDADPQGSLSRGFFGSMLIDHLSASETLAQIFERETEYVRLDTICRKTPIANVSIICANHLLARWNLPEPSRALVNQFDIDTLCQQATQFDRIMIDCPPNLHLCTWNALLASDFALVPVPPEDFGTQGLPAVHQAIEQARIINSRIQLLGHVITRQDRRLLIHAAFEEMLRKRYGDSIFATVIPEASAFKVALACRQPVTTSEPRSRAAQLTHLMCHEMVNRME